MREVTIDYDECLRGKHQRRSFDPLGGWFAAQGARVRSNTFEDPELSVSGDAWWDLQRIIHSGRRQGFEKLVIRIDRTHLRQLWIQTNELMALQRVVIEVLEEAPQAVLAVLYPDVIWLERAYWRLHARSHAPGAVSAEELARAGSAHALRPLDLETRRSILKALDLDEALAEELPADVDETCIAQPRPPK